MKKALLPLFFIPFFSFGQSPKVDTNCLCNRLTLKPNKDGLVLVECAPEYPGGFKSLKSHIGSNIHLNVSDSGTITASFFISCTGTTCGFQIIKTEGKISENVKNEVLSALQSMSNWQPAKQRDKVVNIPVEFKLRVFNGQIQ